MIDWHSPRIQRLLHFGMLYFAQGVMLSYFLTFNILYLRESGLPVDEIGIFQAVLVIPFVLKLVFALISDRFSLFGLGHRLPYILLGLLTQLIALLGLSWLTLPEDVRAFFLVALIASIGMALYDTCTDGLAVESTPDRDRGIVQGMMVGARAAGLLCVLLLGGWVVETGDWSALFHAIALLSLPALVTTLWLWRPPMAAVQPAFDWQAFRAFARRDVRMLALVGVIYTLALDGVLAFLSYHPDAGAVPEITTVSLLVAAAMLGRIGGAVAAGRLSTPLGYRRNLQCAAALSVFACLGLSLTPGSGGLAFICLFFGFAYGYFTTVYASVAMLLSDSRVAASMFAVFMVFLNIGVALGQAAGGALTRMIGFGGLALLMSLVMMALVYLAGRMSLGRSASNNRNRAAAGD